MTEINEGMAKVVEETPPKKTPIKIRCVMFFDGTLNNRTNIQSRIEKNKFYQATLKRKYLVFGPRVGPEADGSYDNNYTNIFTLDKYVIDNEPANGYDMVVKVYTEGAGTVDNGRDLTRGYAFGTGESGIKAKCEKGIVKAVNVIMGTKVGGNPLNTEEQFIEKLTIDVFGFSRGAATARYCIHQVLLDEGGRIKTRLEDQGMETQTVEVCFAGLFDTVSSHGASVALSSSSDVKALMLDAVKYATKTLHLTAGDEHREKFSLTTIASAGGKGEEYYLPGVHSDVGGSYLELDNENFYLRSSGVQASIERDRQTLIEQGWYRQDELNIETKTVQHPEIGVDIHWWCLKATRLQISNAYCNIPLKLMAKYAQEQQIPIQPELRVVADNKITNADQQFGTRLSTLDTQISQYMATSQAAYDQKVKNASLVQSLRGRYMHMSAKESTGMGPRWKDEPQGCNRWREIYEG